LCADRRKCFRSPAQWPAAPNESCVQFYGSCERDLFFFLLASISGAWEDRGFQETILEQRNPGRASARRRFRCQVVDCAPVAGRYAPRGRFPWPGAPLIIRRLVTTPENVADAQRLRSFAPVGRPTH